MLLIAAGDHFGPWQEHYSTYGLAFVLAQRLCRVSMCGWVWPPFFLFSK